MQPLVMEQTILGLCIAFILIELFVELALNQLNQRHVRRQWRGQRVPDFLEGRITPEAYRKSIEYTLAKGRFQRWADLYGTLTILFVLLSGVLPSLDRLAQSWTSRFPPGTRAAGILFCLMTALVFAVLSLPTELISIFVIEDRFGFNKTTAGLYMADKLKALLLGLGIGIPFLFGLLWFMEATGSHWWVWAFLFILAIQLLMVIFYPTLIAPLFNKFEPLKEGELRQRILALAEQVGFRTSGIFTMDGSRRSAHSNAYFTGIGKTKRIVLFDTLVERLTIDQAPAVLAHEMGHYKMKHIRKMLAVQGVYLLAGLYLLSRLIGYEPLFRAFGMEPSTYGALVLFSLLSGPATFYLIPLMNRLSRKHEFEADGFAVRTLKNGKPMEEALINLAIQNLSNPAPHPWYSAYHFSHPSTAERVQAIRQEAAVFAGQEQP